MAQIIVLQKQSIIPTKIHQIIFANIIKNLFGKNLKENMEKNNIDIPKKN